MTAPRAHGHQCGRANAKAAAPTCNTTEARMSADGRHGLRALSGAGAARSERLIREILPLVGGEERIARPGIAPRAFARWASHARRTRDRRQPVRAPRPAAGG